MSNAELHFIGSGSEIRNIHADLNPTGWKFKAAKKKDGTHLFIKPSSATDNDIQNHLGIKWNRCNGCSLCTVKSNETKYVLYPPMILLPTNSSVTKEEAQQILDKFKNFTHVAINAAIKEGDRVRKPQITPLIGDFGVFHPEPDPKRKWLETAFFASSVQNGIYQTWAPLYTMFSRGNITEKKRVLDVFAHQSPISNCTVIDLYAGIGYFTFSYAKQRPKTIYCWEINWWSVEGLMRAAKVNRFNARAIREGEPYLPSPTDEIVIFLEDNQNCVNRLHELDLALLSHINMGLLPHARDAFNVAKHLTMRSTLNPVVHIHENVRTLEIEAWKKELEQIFGNCISVERIKEYSPGVQHLCGDFQRQ